MARSAGFSRYDDLHVDLMDVPSEYGASRWAGLGLMQGTSPMMSTLLPADRSP